jgi:hypothetical protein
MIISRQKYKILPVRPNKKILQRKDISVDSKKDFIK